MASATPPATSPNARTKTYRVALIGNPNTGKSTLFNALAGMNVRTGNYPGVTIEKKVGRCQFGGHAVELVDLPGTYSLAPRSPDELVAVEVLTGGVANESPVDAIVCVVNATILQRNLFLVSQVLELGKPTILALNMVDAAGSRGISIDVHELSKNLGIPVVATSASRRAGVDQLQDAIVKVLEAGDRARETNAPSNIPTHSSDQHDRPLPDGFYATCDWLRSELIAKSCIDVGATDDPAAASTVLPDEYLIQRMLLDRGGEAERRAVRRLGAAVLPSISAARERLSQEFGDSVDMECSSRYAWARRKLAGVLASESTTDRTLTDKIDAVLTHRVGGMFFFIALMFLIFQFIYSWAGIPMDAIDWMTSTISDTVKSSMSPGMLRSLITDGIIAGVGGVLIFVPQIALLFFFLAVLEDCGYMARAAFIVDRVMTVFGLSGKSFLPLMSSFACAVPGIMATRVIENRRDRIATIMVAPLMSCSARLPVYLLLIAAFFPATTYLGGWLSLPGMVLMGMYLVGIVAAIPVAWILKKTLLRGEVAPFVLELPEYKLPSRRVIFQRVWEASEAFVIRAGTLIFAASILIWFAGYWPGDHSKQFEMQTQMESMAEDAPESETLAKELKSESARLLESSLLGQVGHAIEPVVRPLGWDWKIGVGAIASFPAREVIIATLGTIYSLGGDVDESDEGLVGAMRDARWPDTGKPIYGPAVALSLMVFFALCAQCVSTLLVIKRETNSWLWPVISFTYMTVMAYVGALVTFQIASRIL